LLEQAQLNTIMETLHIVQLKKFMMSMK